MTKVVKTAADARIEKLECAVKSLSQQQAKLSKRVESIPESFEDVRQRSDELASRLQMMIFKITVMTEVSLACRGGEGSIYSAMMWALDKDDFWWKCGTNLSVRDWAKRMATDYAREHET